jgi:NADPH-dependent 2,4-dienoyl-CoA reductase/sulfur reductase-like enzyme
MQQVDGAFGVDVAIIGAGPAGMAAAVTCRRHGLSVTVFDDQAAAGGQIYRGLGRSDAGRREILGSDYVEGLALLRDFEASGATFQPRTEVWDVTPSLRVRFRHGGRAGVLQARHVVLATGAMERPFPIPGWTLPGVMGAGAGQILLKDAGALPDAPFVLAGCGPLLYLLAWQYLRAGVPPIAIVDTVPPRSSIDSWRTLPGALANWAMLRKGLTMLRAIRQAGIPFYRGATGLSAQGTEHLEAVSFVCGGKAHRLPVQLLLLHQGVVPNTQFSWALRAPHEWSDGQLCWLPRRDASAELRGTPGVFVVGDGAGIVGARAAALQGERLGWTLALRCGRTTRQAAQHACASIDRTLDRLLRVRPFLESVYRPPDAHRVPADDVIVCRCEEIRAGMLREHVALGCLGPAQLKGFSRCGMGPCQGRLCGLTVTELLARERGVPESEVGYYRVRAPVRPVTLAELAELQGLP